jgi:hypothetical protein
MSLDEPSYPWHLLIFFRLHERHGIQDLAGVCTVTLLRAVGTSRPVGNCNRLSGLHSVPRYILHKYAGMSLATLSVVPVKTALRRGVI